MKKGISLIVLIITIIVIVILAGAVVLNLSDTNIIEQANNAVSTSNLKSNEEALVLYKADLFVQTDGEFDESNLSIVGEDLVYDTNGDGDVTPNISKALTEVFPKSSIVESIDENGKLVQSGSSSEPAVVTVPVLDGPSVLAVNATMDGNAATYSNPIIPKGFKPVSDGADWTDLANNYNKGLVIEDEIENQFVWIPVDGTVISYTKDFSYSGPVESDIYELPIYEGTADATSEDLDSDGIIDFEEYQINTYEGFYIGRYEAGMDGDTTAHDYADNHDTIADGSIKPVSKQGVAPWNWIKYTQAVVVAKSMYDTEEVKSGIMTGRMWDAAMDYVSQDLDNNTNPDYNVLDSRTWGNHDNSLSPANVSGYRNIQITGYSEYWKSNNVYDLAGNASEWTSERYNNSVPVYNVIRGGNYCNDGDTISVSYRGYYPPSDSDIIAFRVALFIQPE